MSTEIEDRLRATLATRAEDVEVTPALWQRVDARTRGRSNGARWAVAAVATLALGATALVVAPRLVDGTPTPDIADEAPAVGPSADPEPSEGVPSEGQEPSGDPAPSEGSAGGLSPATGEELPVRVAVATTDRLDLLLTPGEGLSSAGFGFGGDGSLRSVAVAADWTSEQGWLALLREQQLTLLGDGAQGTQHTLVVGVNGDRVAFSPEGEAVAWFDGDQLHVLAAPFRRDDERVLALPEGAPAGLVLHQWFAQADATVLLATDADGRLWSLPMTEGPAVGSTPTGELVEVPAPQGTVTDALWLDDLRLVTLVDGTLVVDGEPLDPQLPVVSVSGPVDGWLGVVAQAGDVRAGYLVALDPGAPAPRRTVTALGVEVVDVLPLP